MGGLLSSDETPSAAVRSLDISVDDLVTILKPLVAKLAPRDDPQANHFKEALKKIKASYSKKNIGSKSSSDVRYKGRAMQCAYLYLFAPVHMDFVLKNLKALQKNWKGFDRWFETTVEAAAKNELNVCALGGGPGLEAGCVYLWLESLLRRRRAAGPCPVDSVKLTVCDYNHGWWNVFYDLVASCHGFVLDDAGQSRAIRTVQREFIQTDLLGGRLAPKVTDAVKKSDVVTMVKFLSAVSKRDECERMLKNVFNAMKPGAVLIVIDGNSSSNKNRIRNAKGQCDCMDRLLYLDSPRGNKNAHKLHSKGALKKWTNDFRPRYTSERPAAHFTLFVEVLQKRGPTPVRPQAVSRSQVGEDEYGSDTSEEVEYGSDNSD